MTVRNLFGREDIYVIRTDHGADLKLPNWKSRGYHLHTPTSTASAEWSMLTRRYNFGWGLRFGRNGSESDVGLDLHAGPLGNLYLRLRAPWTRWVRVSKDRDPDGWYHARHTGIRLGGGVYWAHAEWDNYNNGYGKREWHVNGTDLWGRSRYDREVLDQGDCTVPMPEGNYPATWDQIRSTRRHVRWPGTWRDRLKPDVRVYVDLSIPGGIPVEGKGENSWDCGMDGILGTSGATVDAAITNAVNHASRDRERYGGPHNLPRPMTISEAAEAG